MNNQKILEQVNQIPPLSPVVVEILNLINSNEDVEFIMLEKKIIKDAGLTGKILSLANSSFFGMPGEIVNIKEACLLLGINTIRNLIISSAVMNRFKNDFGNNLDFEKLWKHGVATAAAANIYSDKLGINRDAAFISGLLHDIGKIILDYYMPDLYKQVVDYKSKEDCLFNDAENIILGTDHCKIGAMVCENWKLPAEVCQVIRSHHDSVDIGSDINLTDVIIISDITSHGLGYSYIDKSFLPIKNDFIFKKPGISISLIEDNLLLIEAITESYISYTQ